MQVVATRRFPTKPISASISGHSRSGNRSRASRYAHQRCRVFQNRFRTLSRERRRETLGFTPLPAGRERYTEYGFAARSPTHRQPMIARQRRRFSLSVKLSGTLAIIRFWLAVIRTRPDESSRSPAGRFSTDVWVIEDTTVFDKQRQVPVDCRSFHPTDTIAATGKSYGRIGSNLIPHDSSTSAGVSSPRGSKGIFGFGVLRSVRSCQSLGRHRFGYRRYAPTAGSRTRWLIRVGFSYYRAQ